MTKQKKVSFMLVLLLLLLTNYVNYNTNNKNHYNNINNKIRCSPKKGPNFLSQNTEIESITVTNY